MHDVKFGIVPEIQKLFINISYQGEEEQIGRREEKICRKGVRTFSSGGMTGEIQGHGEQGVLVRQCGLGFGGRARCNLEVRILPARPAKQPRAARAQGSEGDVGWGQRRGLLQAGHWSTTHALPVGGAQALSSVKTLSLSQASFILLINAGRERAGVDFKQRLVTQAGFFFRTATLEQCRGGLRGRWLVWRRKSWFGSLRLAS